MTKMKTKGTCDYCGAYSESLILLPHGEWICEKCYEEATG